MSRKYLPFVGVGFDNPKVQVHVEDGVEFINGKKERFDVIITDSTDPIGVCDQQVYTQEFDLGGGGGGGVSSPP